jgi:hypothetical protein
MERQNRPKAGWENDKEMQSDQPTAHFLPVGDEGIKKSSCCRQPEEATGESPERGMILVCELERGRKDAMRSTSTSYKGADGQSSCCVMSPEGRPDVGANAGYRSRQVQPLSHQRTVKAATIR